jgi:RHS repeat-associated protein
LKPDLQCPAESFAPSSSKAVADVQATDDDGLPWGGAEKVKAQMTVDGLDNLAGIHVKVAVTFPSTGTYAGIVFGYRDADDYWVYLVKCGRASQSIADGRYIYEVSSGTWTQRAVDTANTSVEPGGDFDVDFLQQARSVTDGVVSYHGDSVEPGTVGLIASVSNVTFDNLRVRRVDWPAPATPTWQVYTGDLSVDTGTGRATLGGSGSGLLSLAVREGFRGGDMEVEAVTSGNGGGLAFRVQDKGNYYFVGPKGSEAALFKVLDGQVTTVVSASVTNIDSGQLHQWYVKAVDDDVDVWVNVNQGGTWSHPVDSTGNGANVLSDMGSGGVGLAGNALAVGGSVACDYLRVGTDGDADHDLADANEAVIDDGFSSVQVTLGYDAAGNLTDDGVYQYVYDAWNRLVQVKRKGGSQPVVATYRYDGLGHRVYKKVENSGDMNREEYFYYNQKWQLLEIDNADNVARQQFVWGTRYIDEAICMDVDTGTDGNCTDGSSRHFIHMQDANGNVVALREGTTIVERYEYDPYGTVRIYRGSASSGAAEQRTVTGQSLKWLDAALPQNPVMYAGYFHDSETKKNYVRNREDDPLLGRWMQPDLLRHYMDGMNLFQYVNGDPVGSVDPSGAGTIHIVPLGGHLDAKCGDTVYQDWDFVLCHWNPIWCYNGAPCDGYFVQKVDVRCSIKECEGRAGKDCPGASPITPSFTFWEAWFVKKGAHFAEGRNPTDKPRIHTTDEFVHRVNSGTCGHRSTVGTVKFFCLSVTGDLGHLDSPAGGWETWVNYPKQGRADCSSTSMSVPSTENEPAWWSKTPVAGPAQHWLSAVWNCCDCTAGEFVNTDASPR